LEERGNLHLEDTFPIFKQICEALGDAHKHGVVHRDVKPDNIVLEEHDNKKNWVKVVDFGIAKLVQGSEETLTRITKTGTVCGSPTYMSPEQFQGKEVDHRSDIYSLGTVLFETLTGRVPFSSVDLVGLMAQHVSEPPPRLSDVRPDLDWPPALEKLVAKALAKDPDFRPSSMEDFQEELAAAQWDQDKVTRAVQSIEELPAIINQRAREVDAIDPDTLSDVVSSQLAARRRAPEEAAAAMEEIRSLFPAASQEPTQRMPRSRVAVPLHVRLIGLLQGLLPWMLTAALAGGLLWVLSNDSKVAGLFEEKLAPIINAVTGGKPQDAQTLFAEGKLAKARFLLEKKDADRSLSPAEFELLNKIYMRLSEQEAAARHYQNAIALLQKISSQSSQYEKAKSLIRKYRRLR
jgi:tetratricopeptide (TPR) repeat protein